MAIRLTQSEENYIKAVYALQQHHQASVGTNELAERMDTKASSVTDMIKRLSEKSLIQYEKYKGCELTEEGIRTALKTIRKHRLWETFLVEKLKFGWDEVHDIAEQLEHIQSVKLTDQLDAFLNYPKFDPHGDPIPDQTGAIVQRDQSFVLNELEIGAEGVVIGVADSSASFLRFLDRYKINIGTRIQIKEIYAFDDSRAIEIHEETVNLSAAATQKITVQKQQ